MTTITVKDSSTQSYYFYGTGVTLVNTGVQGTSNAGPSTGGPYTGIGIQTNPGTGTYANNNTLINKGSVFGYDNGVYSDGSSNTVINEAGASITVTGGSNGAGNAGVNFILYSGIVKNYGVISGYAHSVDGGPEGRAVNLFVGGFVTNTGSLVNGGVGVSGAGGTVINSGVILGNPAYGAVSLLDGGQVTNLSGGRISDHGYTNGNNAVQPYGVTISGGAGTVTNAGTIIGGGPSGTTGFAVELTAGFQNRVIVDTTGVFIGTVSGGTAADATLELASGASKGTLSGFGTQFTNFGTLAFDPAASWLVVTNTAAITSAVIDGFVAGDTIDITGFVAVSETFANNALVLTDGGGAHDTLAIQGSFVSGNFHLAGDGAGGTDITFQTPPPVISGTVAGQTTTDEAIVTPFVAVSITDPNLSQSETITITLSHGGTATDADGTLSGSGLSKTGTGTYTLVASSAAAATAELQGLLFTPTAHQVAPGSSVTTTFTIQATDTAGGTSSNSTTTVGVTAVNDPPVITGATAGQATTDQATLTPFSGVTISDPDFGASETVTITLTAGGLPSDANGTLSGSELTKTGTGTYTLTAGTPAAVTAALRALLFTPTAHEVVPGGTVTTGMTLSVTDGIVGSPTTNTTTSIVATAVNDPPVITGATAGQTTTDQATITPLSGVSVSDVDFGQTETVTVTLSSVANGTLSDVDGGSFNSGTGVYSITGTDGAVSTVLDALVFTPTAHQVAPGSSVTTTFTIQATDTAGGTSSNSTTTVGVTAVNDPPVITGATAGQATTDQATLTPFSGVTISDPDFGASETVTITLTAGGLPSDANGTLSGSELTKTGTGTYTLTAGTPAAVTAALRALLFTPTAHEVVPGGTVTTGMTLSVTDGIVGSPTTNTTTSIVATAVNDPPVITGTVAGQLINDDQTDRPFFGVTIRDPDVGASETVTITLTVDGVPSDANGTLSGAGLTETGLGTGIYTLTAGTPAAVTAALRAVVFTPAVLTLPPGSAAVTDMTLSVSDGIAGSPTTDTTTSVAIVPCFAAGTRIATPRGAIPVERLREGDIVLTVSGKPQPIQWIGCRTLDCNRHMSPERVKPIRIAPHAFGENRPKRALLLSPDHSVFVEDVLIPIKHLINATTVAQIDIATVTYYHIELPRHDVVLAEGLPTETYLETGARFAFENGGGAMQLHPDFAPDEARVGMVWRNFSYAPLIGTDGQLDRVRARLALQALMLGHQAYGASQPQKKRTRRL